MKSPFTETAVSTISIVIITPILYIIGISMNWILFIPNVRDSTGPRSTNTNINVGEGSRYRQVY